MSDATCSETGCKRPVFARDRCEPHYRRLLRAERGAEVTTGPVREGPPGVRIHVRVTPATAERLEAEAPTLTEGARSVLEAYGAGELVRPTKKRGAR